MREQSKQVETAGRAVDEGSSAAPGGKRSGGATVAAPALPPLVFEPRLVPKIWGGRRLETVLGKKLPADEAIGESWEIYDFPPGFVEGETGWLSAKVATGELKGATLHELMQDRSVSLLGDRAAIETDDGPQFPLLIKFLDAAQDLSIQVHPPLEYTLSHPGAHLKTECWIILASEPHAFLYKSLAAGVTREQFAASVAEGTLGELIGKAPARVGDCHFLPSGSLHALGAGTLVAEVQTPSDTTYRVYDFGRVDATTGKPRKLHLEQALDCINFADPSTPAVTSMRSPEVPLVSCEYFKTTTVKATAHSVRPLPSGKMKIWMITEGGVKLRWGSQQLSLRKGQTVLLPAFLPSGLMANFGGNTTYLETVIP